MKPNEIIILILGFLGAVLIGFIITKDIFILLLLGIIGLLISGFILYLNDLKVEESEPK